MAISLNEFADRLNKIMPVIMKGFARRSTNELYKEKITLPQLLVLAFQERTMSWQRFARKIK
jgi:hypothetical protein